MIHSPLFSTLFPPAQALNLLLVHMWPVESVDVLLFLPGLGSTVHDEESNQDCVERETGVHMCERERGAALEAERLSSSQLSARIFGLFGRDP